MSTDASKTSLSAAARPAKPNPRPASKRKPLAKVVFLLIFVAVIAVGGFYFIVERGQSTEASRVGASTAPKYLIHLEGFTVNLNDPEETHFLRITMDLGVDHLPDGADHEKLSALLPVPRIRDSILAVLTTYKASVLLTAEGKAALKRDLVNALNQSVPELGVRQVYFTEFLVQR